MSHDIDLSTGSAAVMVTGEPAWHKLGQRIDHAATSREAIGLAGLDWRVAQWPMSATDPGSWRTVSAPDHVANVRLDTKAVLGVVGKGYHIFQNRDAFGFMDSLVGDKLAMFETAGSLRDGKRVWMLARVPKEYRAASEDVILPYVLLTNSHDGSTALRMIATTVRVVCQNTLNLALQEAGSEGLAIRHHASLEQRVAEARQKLGIIAAGFERFEAEMQTMVATALTRRAVSRYFESLLPPADSDSERSHREQTLNQWQANFDDPTNALPGIRGSLWAAFNAVTEWSDHQSRIRGKDELARTEGRLNSIWFGAGARTKQLAYQRALELAGGPRLLRRSA